MTQELQQLLSGSKFLKVTHDDGRKTMLKITNIENIHERSKGGNDGSTVILFGGNPYMINIQEKIEELCSNPEKYTVTF